MYIGYSSSRDTRGLECTINDMNRRLDAQEHENKVRVLKVTIKNFRADLEKMRLGQKTLYDFKSKKEIELAIIALEKFLLRYSY